MGQVRFGEATQRAIDEVEAWNTHNYHPLPVVLKSGQGEWVHDVEGNRFLDMLSAYSAVNQGHCHPHIQSALVKQAQLITLTSRAFHNDKIGPWAQKLCKLAKCERVLPMNSGAEAVETAVKIARKWGYQVKKVDHNQAEIIVCEDNFHGRTTTVVSFSTEDQYQADFGPFTPGFKVVPYGDANALEKAIGPNTVGFLVEPIQGEAGVVVPEEGYLKRVAEICKANNVLLMVDEIQTGLCRSGKWFAFQYDDVTPDLLILGKALGGGFYPISAVLGSERVLGLFRPGDHGSTFGGNPLACAVSIASLEVLESENLAEAAHSKGAHFRSELKKRLPKNVVKDVRGRGLLNAIELFPEFCPARKYSLALMEAGVLAKDTRGTTLRFAPPLVISQEALHFAIDSIVTVVQKVSGQGS
jgi:ornithine--oxo-acid transaminase